MRYDKTISPLYLQSGATFQGKLYDGKLLIHDEEYSTISQAEQALDLLIVELLTDQHGQGLIDDLAAAIEAEGVTSTHLPTWPIDVEHAPIGWN